MSTIASLNFADYAIIAVVLLSILISLVRGFVREALSLASWILAFIVALKFYPAMSTVLENLIHSPTLRTISAFLILFIGVLIICAIINFILSTLVSKTGLSGTDRLLGMVFGAARGILVVSALLLVAELTPMPESAWWKSSVLIPQFAPIENWLQGFLPKKVDDNSDFKLTNTN